MSVLRQVRWKTVKRKAKECRDYCDGFPVDLDAIADRLNVRVKLMKFADPSVSGVIGYRDDGVTIAINKDHSDPRQRFTLAHEIGHLVLHPESVVIDRALFRNSTSSEAISADEIEANGFAAELLMPEQDIREQIQGLARISEDKIEELSYRYKVSKIAMTVRLTSLGLLM